MRALFDYVVWRGHWGGCRLHRGWHTNLPASHHFSSSVTRHFQSKWLGSVESVFELHTLQLNASPEFPSLPPTLRASIDADNCLAIIQLRCVALYWRYLQTSYYYPIGHIPWFISYDSHHFSTLFWKRCNILKGMKSRLDGWLGLVTKTRLPTRYNLPHRGACHLKSLAVFLALVWW